MPIQNYTHSVALPEEVQNAINIATQKVSVLKEEEVKIARQKSILEKEIARLEITFDTLKTEIPKIEIEYNKKNQELLSLKQEITEKYTEKDILSSEFLLLKKEIEILKQEKQKDLQDKENIIGTIQKERAKLFEMQETVKKETEAFAQKKARVIELMSTL